ncbi:MULTISPECIES: pRL2-11 [Streptomyces]|uniref:pRL2-11 n=1 Tax=Streptomyces TaxID=1883 RepID=UPI00226FB680|nr:MULTISPECIES: pRL2-11 [unclassified Streptomyces]MCY0923712.1 pRL2-11 [Streptomyces sp. H27-G5]MCY0947733.1 pRL2-11 [Streptomyces sp. H34-AA3]MDJ0466994.1 pRL2-11 [Streptomyces sp. H27-C3]
MFAPPEQPSHSKAPTPTDWKAIEEGITDGAKGVWRFASGDTLDGEPRTDRTWTHRGTPLTTKRADGKMPRALDYLSRWETLGLRAFSTFVVTGTGYAAVVEPTETLVALQVSGLAAACSAASWAGFRGVDGMVTWRHRKDWVWPLHVVLRELLGLPEGVAPGQYLKVPPAYADMAGEVVTVELPGNWSPDRDTSTIAQAVISKLGLQDVKASVKLSGNRHRMTFRQSPRAPMKVMYADPEVRAMVEKASASAPFLGLSHRGVAVSIDLDDESPHVMFSAAPGGGKSVLAKAFAAQVLHHGGIAFLIDFKRTSHKWAYGLPNLMYIRHEKDAHDLLIALAAEGNRRMAIAEENVHREMRGEPPLPMGPRILLIMEEANTLQKRLKRYWAKNKPEGEKKNESPAVEAYGEFLFMGRSQLMHALLIGQSLTAQTVGGPEMREAFTARILARYTQNAWRMLVPEVTPIPKASRHSGRVQVVLAGQAHETQVVFMTDEEARELALSGTVTAVPSIEELRGSADTLNNRHSGGSHQGDQVVSDTHGRPLRVVPDPDQAEPQTPDENAPITLAQAAKTVCAGVAGPGQPGTTTTQVQRDLTALRNARGRDKQFPDHKELKGRDKLYDPTELSRWARNRVKSAANLSDSEESGTGTE